MASAFTKTTKQGTEYTWENLGTPSGYSYFIPLAFGEDKLWSMFFFPSSPISSGQIISYDLLTEVWKEDYTALGSQVSEFTYGNGNIWGLDYFNPKEIVKYNIATDTWETMTQQATNDNYQYSDITYLNGKIYCLQVSSDNLQVYDIATNTWSTISNSVSIGYGIATDGDLIYLIGNGNIVTYDPTTGTFDNSNSQAADFVISDIGYSSKGVIFARGLATFPTRFRLMLYDLASDTWDMSNEPPETSWGRFETDADILYSLTNDGTKNELWKTSIESITTLKRVRHTVY